MKKYGEHLGTAERAASLSASRGDQTVWRPNCLKSVRLFNLDKSCIKFTKLGRGSFKCFKKSNDQGLAKLSRYHSTLPNAYSGLVARVVSPPRLDSCVVDMGLFGVWAPRSQKYNCFERFDPFRGIHSFSNIPFLCALAATLPENPSLWWCFDVF